MVVRPVWVLGEVPAMVVNGPGNFNTGPFTTIAKLRRAAHTCRMTSKAKLVIDLLSAKRASIRRGSSRSAIITNAANVTKRLQPFFNFFTCARWYGYHSGT